MDAVVLERADHFQAGAIADVCQAWVGVAAEIALEHPAVGRPVEECPPSFELTHAGGRFLSVQFRHPRVVQVLPTAHRVSEVDLPVVALVHVA